MHIEKRKIIIHIIIIVMLCIPMALSWYAIISNAQTPYDTEAVTATEPRVFVTTYGERYHSADCPYLAKSQHAIGLHEAIDKGYTACGYCGGKPNGTITVTYKKQVGTNSTYKNIFIATALSVICTPAIYLLIYLILVKSKIL